MRFGKTKGRVPACPLPSVSILARLALYSKGLFKVQALPRIPHSQRRAGAFILTCAGWDQRIGQSPED